MSYSKIFYISFIAMGISSITQWCEIPVGNTTLWWILRAIFLLFFFRFFICHVHRTPKVPILVFLFYVVCMSVYGALYKTENYWDWKLLVDNFMIFILPLATYSVNEEYLVPKGINFWIKWAWIPLIILWPFLHSDAFGRYLVPFTLLALMLPRLNKRGFILMLGAFFITIYYGFESRSDIIKFSVSILLGICLWLPYFNRWLRIFIKPAMWSFLLAPFLLLGLAFTGTFNIFEIEEELGIENQYMMKCSLEDKENISALSDTRTFLYVEEIESAIVGNYYIWGNSPARGYLSLAFGQGADEDFGTLRGERQSCEVSILNVFNYFGLVGCFLYFCIFIVAAYKAVYKSENRYMQVIGLYVAFRWFFGFIEDFSRFDLNMMFLWFMIGMCYSERFRQRTDEEFELWFNYILYPQMVAEETENEYFEELDALENINDNEDTENIV